MRIDIPRDDGKRIGCFETDNKTFYKNIKGSKHFLRVPPAIAMDVSCIERLKELDCKHLEVTDLETKIIYYTSFMIFLDLSFAVNRNFGNQLAMTLDKWARKDRNQGTLL